MAPRRDIGLLATVVFLDLNGIWIDAPDDDAYDLVIAVAASTIQREHIAAHLAGWH